MLKGIAASEGIGIGKIVIIEPQEISYQADSNKSPTEEMERLKEAMDAFCKKTEQMAQQLTESVDIKEAEIMQGHIAMIKDPFLFSQMEEQIKEGASAEAAAERVLDSFIEMFSGVEDELTKQRATDVADIKDRLLKILQGKEDINLSDLPKGTVIVTKDLTPSMTVGLSKENICGIVTEVGGQTSHSAILSRAMEIPAVLSVKDALKLFKNGETVIVDGSLGQVIISPKEKDIAQYGAKAEKLKAEKEKLKQYFGKDTVTADGTKKGVLCNIGNPKDGVAAKEKSGEGIGLFRTEFLFMDRDLAPTEEEQFEAYKKVAEIFKGQPVIIRTLDVGGDKDIPYMDMPKEDNPFLGYRAIRYCLDHKEQFKVQLKALLRASAFGNIKIMIPMVTTVSEIREVKDLIKEISEKLKSDGIAHNENIPLGTMIETSAACLIADLLAKECDFFSIGTNDLIQYTMAADRGNDKVAYLYRAYDPAVLRAIQNIIGCAKEAGIPVGMCGEVASDPKLIPVLLGFGLDEFSVGQTAVLSTRYHISKWTNKDAKSVVNYILRLETAEEVERYLANKITGGDKNEY